MRVRGDKNTRRYGGTLFAKEGMELISEEVYSKTFVTQKVAALDIVKPITPVAAATTASLNGYSQLVMGGGGHE